MKVLVVGGAGYIGCVLVRELLAQGHAVRVCDRLFFGDAGLSEVRGRIELETEDIRRVSERQLEGVDAVINLGGISSDPVAEFKPGLTYETNVTGAVHLAEVCKASGVRRYLFASSCSVYDSEGTGDESDVLFDETSPVNPDSAYAKSKLEAEKRLLDLSDGAFCPVLLRKGTVFGFSHRMRFDLVINTLLKDALSKGCMTLQTGGEMWRPVVEVRDAARAYVRCVEADMSRVDGEIFNVVLSNFRVCEMALRIRETLRENDIFSDIRPSYIHREKVRSYRVSGRKLERLGWVPGMDIEQSVRDTVCELRRRKWNDFEHSKYYNIRTISNLEQEGSILC